jgi:hypothetical protein
LFETANGPMALAGPVLRSPKLVNTTTLTSSAVSERCWLIALGVPYLEPPFDETERGVVREGGPLAVAWEPADRGVAGACTDAFGYGFRLPTLAEAQAAFEMRTLSTRSRTSVLVRDDERGLMTVSFRPRSLQGCRATDPGCDWHVEFETQRERSGLLYCVGPASRLPTVEPSDVEIRQCVRRASSEVRRLDRSKLGKMIPDAELELVFAMRRACRTQVVADFDAVAERLRQSAGGVPLHRRVADRRRALAQASNGHAEALAATSASADAMSIDCSAPRDLYRKICMTESCLAAQALYAVRSLGRDPTEKIERLAAELARRTIELGEEELRLRTQTEVAKKVARCAKDPVIARRFVDVLGERPPARPPEPPCVCPIDDLDCGIARLLEPDTCPSSPSQ